jgi:hypothetical protein
MEVTRDLPTPPLPLTTAMTLPTLEYLLRSALNGLPAVLEEQFAAQLAQS